MHQKFKKIVIIYIRFIMAELEEEDIQLIVKYLNGSLTTAESLLFEQRRQNDALFRTELVAYEEAKLAAFVGGKSRIKSILQDEATKYKRENTEKEEKYAKIVPMRAWILRGVAAAVLIGILFGVLNYFTSTKIDTAQLFANNFKPFDNEIITNFRGDRDSLKVDPVFQQRHERATIQLAAQAFEFYNAKNYDESLTYFNKITTPDDTLTLYKANILLSLGKIEDAKKLFINLQNQGKGNTQSLAEWYLALILLKENNLESSRKLIFKLANSDNHPFKKEAIELERQIRKQ